MKYLYFSGLCACWCFNRKTFVEQSLSNFLMNMFSASTWTQIIFLYCMYILPLPVIWFLWDLERECYFKCQSLEFCKGSVHFIKVKRLMIGWHQTNQDPNTDYTVQKKLCYLQTGRGAHSEGKFWQYSWLCPERLITDIFNDVPQSQDHHPGPGLQQLPPSRTHPHHHEVLPAASHVSH